MSIWRLSTVRSLILCLEAKLSYSILKLLFQLWKTEEKGLHEQCHSHICQPAHPDLGTPWLDICLGFGFNQLLSTQPHLPPSTDCISVGKSSLCCFCQVFWYKQEKENIFIFVLFVWILLSFSVQGLLGKMEMVIRSILWTGCLIQRSLLMDIFWALEGKRLWAEVSRGKFMKVCKIRDTSRVTSGSKGGSKVNEEREEGYFTWAFLSECPAATPGQHSGTAGEQPQCPLSQADWPELVCVCSALQHPWPQTHSASQIVLDGDACMDFLSMMNVTLRL